MLSLPNEIILCSLFITCTVLLQNLYEEGLGDWLGPLSVLQSSKYAHNKTYATNINVSKIFVEFSRVFKYSTVQLKL